MTNSKTPAWQVAQKLEDQAALLRRAQRNADANREWMRQHAVYHGIPQRLANEIEVLKCLEDAIRITDEARALIQTLAREQIPQEDA